MALLGSTRIVPLALLSVAVLGGTLYSVINNTYVDTSDPLLVNVPHPLHDQSIFARKSNICNTLFVKKAWGWTSAVAAAVVLTAPTPREHIRRASLQWLAATVVWGSFAAWFFGLALFDRLVIASGGTCVILPSKEVLAVPSEYCHSNAILSPRTHPALFATVSSLIPAEWTGRPRLVGGHDISGHIFLLTLSVLFLHAQLVPAWRRIRNGHASIAHKGAVGAASTLLVLWLLMCLATSVYWHKPLEKLTGFGLGLAGFVVTQLPFFTYQQMEPATLGGKDQ